MRAKRISRDEPFQLIMECRRSGLSDYQGCEANGVLPRTFYMWVSRLRKAGYAIPDTAAGRKAVPVRQEVVKLPVGDSETTAGRMTGQNANSPTTTLQTTIEIDSGSMTIRIYNGADVKVIQSVLQLIGGNVHAW